jgi:hypothetical protein
MAELDFPTKLIRRTKTTLITVNCCVRTTVWTPFKRGRGLNVLSTLLFNVLLEVIVRQAKLQTTGTVFNKQTQLLVYADDIDNVGRSLEAIRDAYLALGAEGLKINEKKTKYMIAATNRTILDAG